MARRKKSTARRPTTARRKRKTTKRKSARRNPIAPLLLLPAANPVVRTKAGRRLKIDSRNKTKASRLLNARKAAKKAHKKMPASVAQGRDGKGRLTYQEAMLTIQRGGQTSRKRKGVRKSTGRKSTASKSSGGSAAGRDSLSVVSTLLSGG